MLIWGHKQVSEIFSINFFIYTWDKHKFLDMTCKAERSRYHLRLVVQSELKAVYMNDFCIALERSKLETCSGAG